MTKKTVVDITTLAQETRVNLYSLYIEATQQLGAKDEGTEHLHLILLEYIEWEKQFIREGE